MLSQHNQNSDMASQRRQTRQQQGPRLAMYPEASHMPQRPSTGQQGASFAPLNIRSQDDGILGLTNTGHFQQHYLQVAQQPGQALPGQSQTHGVSFTAEQYRNFQHQRLDAQLDSAFQGQVQQMSPQQMTPFAPSFPGLGISGMMMPDSAVGMPGNGYLNPMAITSPSRNKAYTPPMQQANLFPQTPESTPFCRVIDFSPIRAPLELPKQIDARRESDTQQASSGLQIIVTEPKSPQDAAVKMEAISSFLPSPPNTVPMHGGRTFDVASFVPGPPLHSMPALRFGGPSATNIDLFNELVDSTPATSPQMSASGHSPRNMDFSPPQMQMTMQPVMNISHGFGIYNNASADNFGTWENPAQAPSDRSNSLSEWEGYVEPTGIQLEEVQAYIEEPDQAHGGKWKCKFPECGKLFGRKENIRSHVQTHLGDRQYRCIHCPKNFVRQHDLKRHTKIHSGVKPYPCQCGNSFARHDALTRHRQRGICNGAVPGVVKKSVKRGRPRKDRLNSEERADKANKTRARVAAGENTRSESVESEAEVDAEAEAEADAEHEEEEEEHNSPLVFDNLDMSPIQQENMTSFGEQPQVFQHSVLELPTSFAPSVFSNTPPCSPYSTGNKPSPEQITMSDFGGSRPTTAGERDSAMGSDTKDIALFPATDRNIVDDIPDLSHSPPSIGMDDVEFNGTFNSSELSHSTGLFNQSFSGNFGQSLSGGFGQSLSGGFGQSLSGGFSQSLSGSLFGGSMFQGGAQDPSWEPDFLNDNNGQKSFHMFDDQLSCPEDA